MSELRVGDWMALETDDGVQTGIVTKIEKTKGTTRYSIDVLCDNQYRSRVTR